MAESFAELRAEIEERRRKKQLEEQETPYSLQMEGKNGPTFTLESVKNKTIPYTVDQSDYEKYADLVNVYTQALKDKSAQALPSTVLGIYDQMRSEGRALEKTGVGSMMYAGGNKLDQTAISQALEAQRTAEEEALKTINTAAAYKNDTAYLLDQKTDDYETYKSVLERAMGKPEEVALAANWGEGTEDEGQKALIQQRDALKAEIDALEYDPSRQVWKTGTKEYTDDEMDALFAAYEEINAQAENAQTTYLGMYQQETAQEAQEWNNVVLGRYQGDDEKKQDAADRIAAMEQERDRAEWEALAGVDAATGEPLTMDQIAERQQKALELRDQIKAVEAQAKGEAQSANEKLNSLKESRFGEASWGRFFGTGALEAVANINYGFVSLLGNVIQNLESIGGNFWNQKAAGYETYKKDESGNYVKQKTENAKEPWTWDKLENYYKGVRDKWSTEAYNARMAISDSEALEWGQEIYVNFVENLPDIIMNIATFGGAAGGDAMVRMQDAAQKFINSIDMGTLQKLFNNMVGNTSFWSSFVREWASDRDELMEEGADKDLASNLATFVAIPNAMTEIGGVQEIGRQTEEAAEKGLKGLFNTSFEEGHEEIVQGGMLNAAKAFVRALFGKTTPLISMTPGETAYLNIPETGKEAAIGFVSGGLMDLTTAPVIDAVQGRNAERRDEKAIGAEVKPEARESLWALAKQVGGEAQRLADQYEQAKASYKQVGELVRAVMEGISGKNASVTQSAMERIDGWQDLGISNAAQDALEAAYEGEELGKHTAPALINDETAMEALGISLQDVPRYDELYDEKGTSSDKPKYAALKKEYEEWKEASEAEADQEAPKADQEAPKADQEEGKPALPGQEQAFEATEQEVEEPAAEQPKPEEDTTVRDFGAEEAYQMGLSGRRQEELEDTLSAIGGEMTGEIQRMFDKGRADLAKQETDRINKVKEWNAGQDGSRVGVLRSIKPEEADKAGVNIVSDEYINQESDNMTALRGLAEATGVNMVLFESPVKEGTHVGDNGWYDRDSRTVYLDIYSGKENEKALLRTAAHELTHFIQDWSPAIFKKYRDFLLDYYYSTGKDTVKKLIQEQLNKDGTLTEAEAMDEAIADASEMMLGGEENEEKGKSAVQALSEEHPRLFVRIKKWIDKWAQALTRAWRGTVPGSMASRMLKESAQTFQDAQRMWWEALEDASINHRGEIREAEIENEKEEKLKAAIEEQRQAEDAAEKAREAALERAGEAETVEAAQRAIDEAKAAEAAREAAAAAAKQEEQRIAREAEKKKREAESITKAGLDNEKRFGRMSDGAREYVRQFAEENGFALDGSAKAGNDLLKEALHYFNQGKAGIAFKANTPGGQGPFVNFFKKINQYGQEEKNRAALEAMAQAEPDEGFAEIQTEENYGGENKGYKIPERTGTETEAKEKIPMPDSVREQAEAFIEEVKSGVMEASEAYLRACHQMRLAYDRLKSKGKGNGFDTDWAEYIKEIRERIFSAQWTEEGNVPTAEQSAQETENRAQETEKTPEQVAAEVVRNGFDDDRLFNREAIENMTDEEAEKIVDMFSRENLEEMAAENQRDKEGIFDRDKAETETHPTPQETQAMETHAETVQKIEDVLKGMTKKARNLVMEYIAKYQPLIKWEPDIEPELEFAQYAKKWYDAGREKIPVTMVPWDEIETHYPPFLGEDVFYKQGKVDRLLHPFEKKEAKENEKPADKGAEKGTDDRGDQAGRLLEGVPAEDVQANGGERRTVSGAQEPGRADVGNDAEPDGAGPVRERGEGVSERDHVRHGAGELTEAEAEAEPETPEETQARETEEAVQEKAEETKNYLNAETPKGTNYVIGDSLNIAKSTSEKARYQDNVEAIRLLKKIEAEDRYATQEEQEILSRYVGWGGLKNAFSDADPKWKKQNAELRELLTPEEYRAANASVLNAHYTSIEVIRAMYEGLRHLGFQGGRMLEPSGGIGHFIGAMPTDMQQSVTSWTMVELDSITGRIAKKLYPLADVRIQGFQDAEIGNGIMDVAIGNVPFGDFKIVDKDYPKVNELIHNYFFVKSIDKVRPGGLMMFITSHGTMDSRETAVRSILAKKADLLGAVRLPNTAFKGNANTPVVTDILIFRRRADGTPYKGEKFEEIRWMRTSDGNYAPVSEYFANHPDMILGKTTMQGTMYRGQGQEMTVEALPGDIGKQIVEAMNKIKGKMDYSQRLTVEQVQAAAAKARKQTRKNGYEVRNGKLYRKTEDGTAPVEMEKGDAERVIGALQIRDTARELQELQKRGASEQEKQAEREKLNRQYDGYVKQYGPLHNQKNQKLILEDPDGYFMLSLENWDKKKKIASKADIFTKDTIAPVVTATHADTPVDAVSIVINEKGYIDLARAAELLGVTEDAARDAILESESAYLNDKGALEPVATYLSGDTRAKLRMARQLATVDKRYQKNVEALEKIIPPDVKREEIKLRPGMTWIPNAVYEQFICEMLGKPNTRWKTHVKVAYDPYSGKYTIEADTDAKYSYANTDEWGTKDYTFLGILDNIMNSKEGKVKYKDRETGKVHTDADATKAVEEQAKKIIAKFQEWLWQDENRAKSLETMYNDLYNSLVTPKYNGDNLTIAGANAGKQLRPHQRNMVQRIIQGGGNVLIAHCVGAGKTAEMAGAAMKLRQLGIVNKPVFVVPKALVGQWASEFLDFFPAAKVMALGENDFTPKNRKEFANRITTGDYDAVIMSYEQFKYIQMTPENQRAFYQNQIDQITEAIEEGRTQRGGKPLSVRELESTKKKLEAKLDKLKDAKKDEAGVYFEDMGIDSLFVDEAHYYKKLFFRSGMGRIKGVGDGSGNPTTYDMYQKIKWLQKMNGGRGIVFATATPVMNSMSETYNMQRYLQEDKLEQIGIRSFDAWAAMFGEVITKVEQNVTGKMEEHKLFAKFKNMPELQRLIQSFMDVLTVDDLKETMRAYGQELKIPKMKGGKRIVIHSERSPFQTEYLEKLGERADKVKGSFKPKKGEDNMAVISMDGRKMSYTQHMIDPKLPYEEGCKVVKCVDNVAQIWKDSAASKGTQIIFLDMGVPKSGAKAETETDTGTETEEEGTAIEETKETVDFYNDMKRMLIAQGVPAEQIAFISDPGNNQKKKLELYKKVKEGQIRILIGSTGKMGVGMNAQDRVVALHHLDAPWRPGDIEQREGRALRQGNMNDEVAVYVYVTDDTFDTYMWQTLEWKANVTHNVMNGTNTAREIDGDSPMELSFAEIKAVSQSNPLIKEQFEVGNKIRELEGLEREHNKERQRARENIAENRINIENRKLLLPKAEADAKTAKAALDGSFVMKVDGKRYTERAKAAAALMDTLNKHKGIMAEKKVGEFGGFTLAADGRGNILIKGQSEYKSEINYDSDTGTMTRLMNRVKDITGIADNMRASITRMEEENRKSEKKASQPFERTAELEELRERKAEIDAQLNPVQSDTAVDTEEDAEEKPEGRRIKYSRRATESQDAEYMKAVESGDMETAQKMVDEAAKEAGYIKRAYHGTKRNFYEFKQTADDLGIHLGTKGQARMMAGRGKDARIINAYVRMNNPINFEYDHGGWYARNVIEELMERGIVSREEAIAVLYSKDRTYQLSDEAATKKLRELLMQKGYDGFTYDNLYEGYSQKNQKSIAVFTPEQIKSAEPVTYDSQGNIIPISERFNPETKDIRRSTRDPEDLSNRQLLARAYEGIIADESDRKYLERYKEIIAQLDADAEEVKKLKREYHDKTFVKGKVDKEGAAKARAKYLALEQKITQADETLLRLERSEPLKKALEFEKKEAKRKAEEKAANTVKAYHEGVSRREYAVRIKKTAERLGQWLNHPDNTKHVPKAAQQAVADFLLTITQSSKAEFKGPGGARRERNFIESMKRLKDFVEDVNDYKTSSAEERVEADFGQFIDNPDGFKEQIAALIKSLERTIGTANRVNVVDDMTSEQMKELYKIMATVSKTITTINDFLADSAFKHVDAAAQNTMRFIRDQGRVEERGTGRLSAFINWENTQPIRALERFGEGGMAIWNGIRKGQGKLAFNLEDAITLSQGKTAGLHNFTEEEIEKWGLKGLKGDMFTPEELKNWRETIKEFSMGGRRVLMTADQAMNVYNALKRGQAVGHIFGEGIRVTGFRDKKRKMIRDKGGAITQEEAAAIAAYVESNPRMKQIADNMQRIISNFGKKMGNPVNMKRFGYEFMNEDYYWPIETDPLHRQAKTDNSKGNELYRLLNISSVKPLTEGARNRIVIRGAFDVFAQNLIDMAQYNALALPVLDAVKWINYREKWEERTEDGRIRTVYGDGIRDAAYDTYGGQAARYIIELLKDIQGVQAAGDWGEDFSRKMLMRYNKAAIAANLSVAAKQPMSITRAAMELGSIDLITGALKNVGQYKHNLETMLKYSGIAVWKINMGFYDVNVSRSAKRLILRDDTKIDKLLNATTALNEKMDTVTWAAIWGACETWTRKHGGIFDSTDAFYEAVAEKFEDVIYKTQVVDSILTRSQFMRGTSFMNKWFSSFMSEPTTSYNVVLDAWWRFKNDLRRGLSIGQAFAENRQQILRTTAVYMVSAAVMTLLEALIGAWRDDDDYETFLEKFNAGLLNNAIDELNVLNNLPIVRDVMDYVKQAAADYVLPDEWNIYANAGGSPVFSGLDTLKQAGDVWDKILSGNSNYTLYGGIYKTASALSQISGIPVAPAMREVVALWNNTVAPFLPEMRIETYESTVKQGAAALYKAIVSGDKDRERVVRGQLAANNADDSALETALKTLISADLQTGKITNEQAEQYLQEVAGLGKNEAYYKVQQWQYKMESGNSTTSDYAGVWLAIDSEEKTISDMRKAIDEALKHGKEKKGIASSLTNKYKETYQYLLKTDKSAAATLKWKLINAFDYLGYEGKKKVEEWE